MGGRSGLVNQTRLARDSAASRSLDENIAEMFAFSAERHRMQVRRQRGEDWPWSDDPILTHYHFCNIFRELDRTTIWIKRRFLGLNLDHPNLWFAACLARRINYPPTLMELGFPTTWDPEQTIRLLRDRMARGEKTFNPNAYRMVGGGAVNKDMTGYIINRLLQPVWEARESKPVVFNSLREAVGYQSRFYGWGSMVSYQVALDLVGTAIIPFPLDQDTWCNVGPGGIRGLNRIFGRPLEMGLAYHGHRLIESCLEEIKWLQDQQRRYWPEEFPRLFACDVENCLCEYDKFMRIVDGQLTGQRKYTPNKETWR